MNMENPIKLDPLENRDLDIAIVGMACRFPDANHYLDYWNNLLNGKDSISAMPEGRMSTDSIFSHNMRGGFITDVDKFDAEYFGISPREAISMDPQQRIMLELASECIEDASYTKEVVSGKNIGIFLGVGNFDYKTLQDRSKADIDRYYTTGTLNSIIANRLSYFFNLHGPSVVVDAACASSLVAVHQAVCSIKLGECDSALAGGVSLMLSGERYVSFTKMEMLSSTGIARAFDSDANGYVRGEGAGLIFLKRMDTAIRDKDNILAVIKGGAVNHNGRGRSLTSPNAIAQSKVIRAALKNAKICPSTVTYIESHGTGTPLGDPIEMLGLKIAFEKGLQSPVAQKRNYCAIGAVKNNIGHLEPAAGIASVIKTVLAIKNKKIPKNIHIQSANKKIELNGSPFYLADSNESWVNLKDDRNNIIPLRAGISSFGLGGINSHILIEEYLNDTVTLPANKPASKFERGSYWISSDQSEHFNDRAFKNAINLLGERIDLPTEIECHQVTLHQESLPYLWDHVINGTPVFPGAGFIASALSIANTALNKPVVLNDIQLTKFIQLQQGSLLNTTLSLKDKSIGLWSKSPSAKNDVTVEWDFKASATFSEHIKDAETFVEQEEFLGRSLNIDDIYSEMQTLGLEYGNDFRVLTSIRCTNDISVCDVHMQYEGDDASSYLIHPIMLDGIMQAAYPLLRTKINIQDIKTIIPVAINSIYFSEAVGNRASVKAVCTDCSNGYAIFNFYIYVDGGREAGVIMGLKLSIINKEHDNLNIFYKPEWESKTLNQDKESNRVHVNDYVIALDFSSGFELQDVLSTGASFGNNVTYISASFEDSSCWDSLKNQLKEALSLSSGINTIYYFSSKPFSQKDNNALLERVIPAYFEYNFIVELINLVGKLSGSNNKIILKFVTDKAFPVIDISSQNPFSAVIHGLCRTASAEYENLEAVHIDMDYDEISSSPEEFIRKIKTESASKNANLVAWRNSDRFIRTLKKHVVVAGNKKIFKTHGTCIVVGGSKGIGYQLSIELAKKYQANLILIGRGEIDASLKQRLDYLNQCGGNPSYYQADLAKKDQILGAINACYEKYDEIDCVLHSAVALNDQLLQDIDRTSLYESLDAKIKGSINLLDVLQNKNVGALVYFSSVAAYYPSVGQAAYTAGNIFQNSLVDYLQKDSRVPIKSISWGPWDSLGIVANDKVKANLMSLGFGFINAAEGFSILENFLASDSRQLVAFRANDAVKELIGITADKNLSLSLVHEGDGDHYLYDWLHEQLAAILKMERTSSAQFKSAYQMSYLSELGVDSLAAMELRAKIKNRFMIDFSIEVLLGATRLGELVEKMYARIGELSANKSASETLSAESESREVFVI